MRNALIVLSFILLPLSSWGWGQTGHRVIGRIADDQLNDKARSVIETLLEGESLAMVSTYMDEIRSDSTYDHTHSWHWVTIPDGKEYAETEKNPEGDLVEAIERMVQILSDQDESRQERAQALRYLVHLVGDLHQPLHVGNGTDRGGNAVKVKWFGDYSNLHRVWDSEMIDSKRFSYSELAYELQAMYDQKRMVQWSDGTVRDWAHEAMQYREQVYDYGNPDRMGYRYSYQNWDLVERQLTKGGVRLASLLNRILG